MGDPVSSVLQFARELRASRGFRQLEPAARAHLERDLSSLESALGKDPYAQVLDLAPSPLTPLEQRLRGGGSSSGGADSSAAAPSPQVPAPAAPPPALPQTAQIGQRSAQALEAVNFPGFVAALLTGTFQAIVDATAQQVREYAKLVASITQSLGDFTEQNVTLNQTRDHLAELFPQDLQIALPAPGSAEQPRLLPRPDKEKTSPAWLSRYGLEGEELSAELTEGPLLEAGRSKVGEERLQTLATMVLMGINRIVVNEGDVTAKLQFHATATDTQTAEVQQTAASIAGRDGAASSTQMMVSTLKANAQADASIKADLMGQVRITFRSETFPLERFANTAAIQLINQHARWRTEEPAPARPAAAAGTVAASAPTGPAQPAVPAPTPGAPR